MWETLGAALDDPAHRHWRLEFPGRNERLTGSDLQRYADRLAGALRAQGVKPGAVVGLLAPTGMVIPISLFAIWRAGAAVSVLPVKPVLATDKAAAWLARIVEVAGMTHVIVDKIYAGIAVELAKLCPSLTIVDTRAEGSPGSATAGEPAIVQFTSGSTSVPKGVVLPHRAVLAGVNSIITDTGVSPNDTFVQWIPFFHDLGLISHLAGLFGGAQVHTFSPMEFMLRPANVMRHFADMRATAMSSPNFGYDRMLDQIPNDVDLSSWRVAYNGAEMVQPSTVERFGRRIGRNVMLPCYGMAEATLGLTFHPVETEPVTVHIDRSSLANSGEAVKSSSGKAMVSVGRPASGIDLRLVNDLGVCGESQVGEIQARGPAIMSGYLNNPTATAEAFDGEWFRTGDLGFQLDGNLYITGRRKEMIVAYGQNFYPEDVELIVRDLPGVYRSRCVAFAHEERIVVAVEATKDAQDDLATIASRHVASELGLTCVDVHVVPRRWLPQTSSGKWQRTLTRDLLLKTSGLSEPGRNNEGELHAHA